MKGETIVVFGGTSGIGQATARACLERGARVVVVGRDPRKLAEARERLGEVRTASVDGSDPERVRQFFREWGSVDHLVVSLSGAKGAGPFRTLALEDLRAGLEQKLLAQANVAQGALDVMRKDGSMTFVSAASARSTLRGTAGLAAINAAVEAMVRVMALELAPLRVNAVSPGVIDTAWWDRLPGAAKGRVLPAGRGDAAGGSGGQAERGRRGDSHADRDRLRDGPGFRGRRRCSLDGLSVFFGIETVVKRLHG